MLHTRLLQANGCAHTDWARKDTRPVDIGGGCVSRCRPVVHMMDGLLVVVQQQIDHHSFIHALTRFAIERHVDYD